MRAWRPVVVVVCAVMMLGGCDGASPSSSTTTRSLPRSDPATEASGTRTADATAPTQLGYVARDGTRLTIYALVSMKTRLEAVEVKESADSVTVSVRTSTETGYTVAMLDWVWANVDLESALGARRVVLDDGRALRALPGSEMPREPVERRSWTAG